jgi:glucosamine--fructose-6-phosphate aminotransferase (isomerizing)
MISQSGETADLIHCLKIIKEHNLKNLIITNTGGSTLDRNCMYSLLLHSGVEVSVASTKAYVAQVTLLAMLAGALVNDKKVVDDLRESLDVVYDIQDHYKPLIMKVADEIKDKKNIFYLGRSFDYFLSLEASLKLKEISYIHSEAIPGGELKHGPIALVDDTFFEVFNIIDNWLFEKSIGGLHEVLARGGHTIVLTDAVDKEIDADDVVRIETPIKQLVPILLNTLQQLLAYYVAVERGNDVDQPRNLAKSVTVE